MSAQQRRSAAQTGVMNVDLLNAGWINPPAGLIRTGEPMDRRARCPVPAYVIETDEQRILVDTGLHPAAVADGRVYYDGSPAMELFGVEQEASIADQVDLDSITLVVLTHLHFDHAGGLPLVPESVPLVVQRVEWEAAHDRAGVERNYYLPRDYAGDERQVTLVDGDHDLLGDGSIELLSTPGHTPGHQSVRVGNVVLGGDVVHYATGLDDHRFPSFGDDRDEQGRSADRLRELRDAGLGVLPGHDPDVLRPGRVYPAASGNGVTPCAAASSSDSSPASSPSSSSSPSTSSSSAAPQPSS
jgi:N-acyl homoserine lactone hydrolase